MDKNENRNQNLKEKTQKIYKILKKLYPHAHCTLDYHSPFQLLIMTILASQCTDERVNQVSRKLFQKLQNPSDFLKITQKELEELIRPVGFYRNKANNIRKTCKILCDKYNNEIPNSIEHLLTLPGVGRKTANVILGECFNIPAIIVDTHCQRLSQRLGLTSYSNPTKIEQDLQKLLSHEKWTFFSHLLVFHGRNICHARKPNCTLCPLKKYCNYYQSNSCSNDKK